MLDVDVVWDLVELTSLRELSYFRPICLTRPFDGTDAKLPGAVDASLLLHAVRICTIVNLHRLAVKSVAVLFQFGHSGGAREVHEELEVDSTTLAFL